MISFESPAKEEQPLGSEDSVTQGSMVCHLSMVGVMRLCSKSSLLGDGPERTAISGQIQFETQDCSMT